MSSKCRGLPLYFSLLSILFLSIQAHDYSYILWFQNRPFKKNIPTFCKHSRYLFHCEPFQVSDIFGYFFKSSLAVEEKVAQELSRIGWHPAEYRLFRDRVDEVRTDDPLAQKDDSKNSNTPPALWGLDRINQDFLPLDGNTTLPKASPNVRVYVIDTGITVTHPDFKGRAVWGANFADTIDSDCGGHGTHVAGTIGSSTYGVAPNVQLVAVKVLGCNGQGSWKSVIKGIEWIIKDVETWASTNKTTVPLLKTQSVPGSEKVSVPVRAIVNASLGGKKNELVNRCYNELVKRGIALVVSAGNRKGQDACHFTPAGASLAITVGATNWLDEKASYSNIGACVDLLAPGSFITSLYPPGLTAVLSGTSMASPHVAGVLALLLSQRPYTMNELKEELRGLATKGVVTHIPMDTCNLLLRAPK